MPTLNPLEHDGKNRSSKDYRFLCYYGSLKDRPFILTSRDGLRLVPILGNNAEPNDIQDSDFRFLY